MIESLKLLEGLIDIYLPDFKYYNDKLGKYSNISNYFETASLALKEMYRQVGKLRYNKDGILVKGMIVRHLVLPNNYDDSKKIIKYLYDYYKDNIIIGNDSYTEDNHSTGIYRMNLLGKVYGEYLLSDDYYGNSIYADGNIYALSKNIVMIDSQTGTISNLGKNDNYSYINVINGNVIVGKEDKFYSVKDNKFSEVESSEKSNIYSFYDGISEYKIVKGVRYGKLTTTNRYDKDISIIKYDKYDGKDINIKMDVNRISIYNNTGKEVYLILDKLFDKRIYEVKDTKYVNLNGLKGKYTIYYRIDGKVYKTDYYIEV